MHEQAPQTRQRLRLQVDSHTRRLREPRKDLTAADTAIAAAQPPLNEAHYAKRGLLNTISEAERQLATKKCVEAAVASDTAVALTTLTARYPVAPTGRAVVTR